MISLKKAYIEDFIELQKICADAYAQHFRSHWYDGGLEWYLEQQFGTDRLTTDLHDEETDYYFIEFELQTIGFIKIRNGTDITLAPGNGVELEKIYILPSFKGKGIGKSALGEIIKIVKTRSKDYLFLCVIDTNVDAIAFYQRLSFKFHGKTTLDIPYFKEELKGMNRMIKFLH